MTTEAAPAPTMPASLDDYLDHVAAIGPDIEGAAAQAETDQRLPPALLAALHSGGMFRLLLPKSFGGGEIDPPGFFQVIEAVARHDASTAWCLCQGNGCAMSAAYLDPAVAGEIWGGNPEGVLAWGPGGKSKAIITDGGYRLTGSWSFASGMHHASWLGGQCTLIRPDGTPVLDGEGNPVWRVMLFPITKASIRHIWDVVGLRGTGSDGYTIDDMFIPEAYALDRHNPAARRQKGPLYLFPQMSLYASGFSGTAMGIARAMLEAFKDLAVEKTPRLARLRLGDDMTVQADVGRSEARLGAARAFLLSELNDIWQAVNATGELTVAERMRIRLAATYGIHEAKAVADTVYDLAGATAIFQSSPFERRFRDLHTVTQQLQGRRSHFHSVGSFLLGNPPDMAVI